MQQKLFGTLKVTLKINKKKNKTFFQGYLIFSNPIQIAVFFQTCRDFVLYLPELPNFEGSNISSGNLLDVFLRC